MRALLAVTLGLSLGAACSEGQARTVHRAGEVATAGGLIGVLTSVTMASLIPQYEHPLVDVGIAFVPVTLVGALAFIATDSMVDPPSEPARPSRRERKRSAAWELTKQAAEAARERDCLEVEAIAPRVRDLDREFHVQVFMRDAAIKRCLAQ